MDDGVRADQDVGDDGESLWIEPVRKQAVVGSLLPERRAQLRRRSPTRLACLRQLRLQTLGLDSHLEERPRPLRDADGHVGEGLDPLGQVSAVIASRGPSAVRDIDRLDVTDEGLVDDRRKRDAFVPKRT